MEPHHPARHVFAEARQSGRHRPGGYAGLEDGVDWHWDRVFAGAALTTLLGVGAELAAPQNRQNGNRVIIAGQGSLQDSVNQVGQEMTRRNINIQPTLTERPGLPVRIIVNRDLVLRPYQPLSSTGGNAMSTTRSCGWGRCPIPSVKLTFACPASEGRPRPLRRAARAYGEVVCREVDPAHAGGIHGGDRGFRKGTSARSSLRNRPDDLVVPGAVGLLWRKASRPAVGKRTRCNAPRLFSLVALMWHLAHNAAVNPNCPKQS